VRHSSQDAHVSACPRHGFGLGLTESVPPPLPGPFSGAAFAGSTPFFFFPYLVVVAFKRYAPTRTESRLVGTTRSLPVMQELHSLTRAFPAAINALLIQLSRELGLEVCIVARPLFRVFTFSLLLTLHCDRVSSFPLSRFPRVRSFFFSMWRSALAQIWAWCVFGGLSSNRRTACFSGKPL